MGSSQSAHVASSSDHDDEEDEEEEEEHGRGEEAAEEGGAHHDTEAGMRDSGVGGSKKVLRQEPEMLPCHSSASPLSPQPSAFGTPRLGPSIKVWDPFNVLAPPPTDFTRSAAAAAAGDDDRFLTELFLICNAECHMNLRPDLIGGRCPDAALTPKGKRQSRALAVFLKSQGVRFTSVYTSPLDRARATAASVCQELKFPVEEIQSSDALLEMSQGHWEGCHRSEIFTPETTSLMERFQPDFSPPSGESLRQVEYRMVQFLNGAVMALPEKFSSDFSPPDQIDTHDFSTHIPPLTNSVQHLDLLHRQQRQGHGKKKSVKSRLQIVASTGDQADDEMSPRVQVNTAPVRDINTKSAHSVSSCVGIFTHGIPIKCLLTGILGCSAMMSSKICVDDSSVTVLQHSWKRGWQIKRLNDISHLRLL
ncbi:unnamed protein product [Cuscuta campestris]|uniref:Uncharacterized protein n=1 Tax=Cuscuta campestris TaxID=132261 RepID=A0A484LVM0_9ASTE|nr:unnamed protein product [Cuscuta campestris]